MLTSSRSNRNTGEVVWDVPVDDFKAGHAITAAPLVVKDKVIVGNAGGDLPTRGFLDAYDPATGKRVWRFYTIPAPGEPGSETWSDAAVLPRGGGATWMTGSYDPELNLIYWGTGNPNPDYYGLDRQGDNLYTASLIAVDADTGSCAGISSSRRTICTTGIPITCRYSPTSRSAARLARS